MTIKRNGILLYDKFGAFDAGTPGGPSSKDGSGLETRGELAHRIEAGKSGSGVEAEAALPAGKV